nr:MAG TPA: hypothetical protein [Caudoviricetes sp.]
MSNAFFIFIVTPHFNNSSIVISNNVEILIMV